MVDGCNTEVDLAGVAYEGAFKSTCGPEEQGPLQLGIIIGNVWVFENGCGMR